MKVQQQEIPSDVSSHSARYELTVDGRIGPMLRSALRLPGGDVARTCIVVRADGPDDLVGLMGVLGAHGLEVDNVSQLPTGAPDG
jgi:hypothetical protein